MDTNKGEIVFHDAEFDASGHEKIKYGEILMNQVNYVRYLMSQDMGAFTMFDLIGYTLDTQKESFWFANLEKFINSVESLSSLLVTSRDDDYVKATEKYNKEFEDSFKKKLTKLDNTKKDYDKKRKIVFLEHNLKYKTRLYKLIFEECLKLAQRAGYISGNDSITDYT